MLANQMSTSGSNRTEQAPDYWNYDDGRTAAAILSASLAPDEVVEWTWMYYGSRPRVTGYVIRKKATPNR